MSADRANYLTVAQTDLLNDWGRALRAMFHGDCSYHVGSSLIRPDWRDVDVRHIVSDDAHAELAALLNIDRLNLTVSLWGAGVTGLPIDWQIQPMSEANGPQHTGRRHPLGISERGWRASQGGGGMSDDLTERLRLLVATAKSDPSWVGNTLDLFSPLFVEAADRIERDSADLETLRSEWDQMIATLRKQRDENVALQADARIGRWVRENEAATWIVDEYLAKSLTGEMVDDYRAEALAAADGESQ